MMRLFTDGDQGRFSVLDDGMLVIERVNKEDAGDYVCEAQSAAGSAFAKARLDVKGYLRNFT
jgi:Immunoglobulin I-set domain